MAHTRAPVDRGSGRNGATALWRAACAGNAGAVELLLDAGAGPLLRTASGSPLECAQHQKQLAARVPAIVRSGGPFGPDCEATVTLLERAVAERKR